MKMFRARPQDEKDLFQWRNDEQSVAMSLDNHRITWKEHTAWYSNALNSKYKYIYFASDPNIDDLIGTVRFDIESYSSKETNPDKINPKREPKICPKANGETWCLKRANR